MHIFPVNFANFFRNNFIMENLLRTGFERRILQNTANQRDIVKLTALSKNRDCEGKTIDRKLIVMVIFNSFTDISFLKDFPNTFFLSLPVLRKKIESALRYSFQQLFLYILSGKGANQLELLLITTLENIQRNSLHLILFY